MMEAIKEKVLFLDDPDNRIFADYEPLLSEKYHPVLYTDKQQVLEIIEKQISEEQAIEYKAVVINGSIDNGTGIDFAQEIQRKYIDRPRRAYDVPKNMDIAIFLLDNIENLQPKEEDIFYIVSKNADANVLIERIRVAILLNTRIQRKRQRTYSLLKASRALGDVDDENSLWVTIVQIARDVMFREGDKGRYLSHFAIYDSEKDFLKFNYDHHPEVYAGDVWNRLRRAIKKLDEEKKNVIIDRNDNTVPNGIVSEALDRVLKFNKDNKRTENEATELPENNNQTHKIVETIDDLSIEELSVLRLELTQNNDNYIKLHEEVESQIAVAITLPRENIYGSLELDIVGILSVEHPEQLYEDDQDIIFGLAKLISQTLKRIRLQDNSNRLQHTRAVLSNPQLTQREILREAICQVEELMSISHHPREYIVYFVDHNINEMLSIPSDINQPLEKKEPEREDNTPLAIDLRTAKKPISINGRAIKNNSAQNVANIQEDEDYVKYFSDTVSQMSIPIKQKDWVIGTLSVESFRGPFDDIDFKTLQIFVDQVISALGSANSRKQQQIMEELYSANKDITMRRNLQNTLRAICQRSLKLLFSQNGITPNSLDLFSTIRLVEGDKLVFQAASSSYIAAIFGADDKREIDISEKNVEKYLDLGDDEKKANPISISAMVVHNRVEKYVYNLADNPDYMEISPTVTVQYSVPLIFDDQVIGVLSVESAKLISKDDRNNINLLADFAAIAVYNEQQYQHAREQLNRDIDKLDKNHTSAQKDARNWTLISMVIATLGAIAIVVSSIIFISGGRTEIGVLAGVAGVITEAIAFLVFNRTTVANERIDKNYNQRLAQIQDFKMLLDSSNQLPPHERNRVIAELIQHTQKVRISVENKS